MSLRHARSKAFSEKYSIIVCHLQLFGGFSRLILNNYMHSCDVALYFEPYSLSFVFAWLHIFSQLSYGLLQYQAADKSFLMFQVRPEALHQ